jgi:hypothetical protein
MLIADRFAEAMSRAPLTHQRLTDLFHIGLLHAIVRSLVPEQVVMAVAAGEEAPAFARQSAARSRVALRRTRRRARASMDW